MAASGKGKEATTMHDKFGALMANADLDRDKVVEFYDGLADGYDARLAAVKSVGPTRVADILARHVTDPAARKDLEILDVAAGTGRGGDRLVQHGFKKIDAIDASRQMLDVLESKRIYRNAFCRFFGGTDDGLEAGSYDAVVVAGGFSKHHLPVSCLEDVARVLRPGGLFVNGMTLVHLEFDELRELEPTMVAMEERGVWTRLERFEQEEHSAGKAGLYHVYKKN